MVFFPPRTAVAILIASPASSASGCSDIGQASKRRPHKSRTEAKYSLPSSVGISVMSYADSWNMPISLAMVHVGGGFEVQKVGIVG